MPDELDFEDFVGERGGFLWVNSSSEPCTEPDGGCESRDGETRTLDDWTEDGLPRTGWSQCGGNCKCVLVPMVPFAFGIDETLDEEGELGATAQVEPEALPKEYDARKPWDRDELVSEEDLVEWAEEHVFVGTTGEEIAEVMDALEDGSLTPNDARDRILEILAGTAAGNDTEG